MPSFTRSFRALIALGLMLCAAGPLSAQAPVTKTPINQPENPLLHGFRWRSIGPVGPGGRVDDIAVDEKAPSTWYVGFAASGVLKTVNNGTTFEPIFDAHASSIADIALAPSDPNVIYVATGEANNRQTTSYGDGLYKSTNAGRTFVHVGFRDAQTLGRVIVHPRDPNTAWIAVGGHLYGPNAERGVFMTTDGGKTWHKTLYIDENTGATELVIDPSNPMNLWAAMYQHSRTAWGFVGGGAGSAIWQSTDGGRKWVKLAAPGLPRGTMGRIALDVCRKNPNTIYALIEVAPDKEPAPAAALDAAAAAAGRGGRGAGGRGVLPPPPPNPQTSGVWRSNDKGKSWTFVSNENQRPMYFSQIRADPSNCETVYQGGVGPTKSVDGGKTWMGLNNMGHVDNHAIWIDPSNSQHVIYGNDGGIDVSYDAGATWESVRPTAAGLAYHASADMRRPYFVCTGLQDNGSWCGPSSVRNDELREGGMRQWMWTRVGGGDGFQNAMDPTDHNIFYTSSQNANIARYNLTTGEMKSIKPTPGGGRGGGGGGGEGEGGPAPAGRANIINPIPGTTVQFNWNTPVIISPHNPSTLLLGGRSLFISRDRGDSWTMTKELGKGIDLNARKIMDVPYSQPACSGRGGGAAGGTACILSKGDGYGANEYGSMTEVAESPVQPGVLWAGTDDGNVQVSRDGGFSWEEVGKNVPGVNHETYVSGLEASWYDAGTAYLALDGHRNDDLKPYVFKTTDFGKTWTSVSGNLPAMGNLNSIRQDPVNRNLLYAATEMGFFVSLDDGKNWNRFMPNLPIGRVDEVLVHPRDHDLILSTHSRSVWILDDITALQRLTPDVITKDATVFPVRDAIAYKSDRRLSPAITGDKVWAGESAPRGTAITWYAKSGAGDATITISDVITGQAFRAQTVSSATGLNRFQWDLCSTPVRASAPPPDFRNGSIGGVFTCVGGGRSALPGTYRVTVTVGGKEIGTQTLQVLEDIWLNER